MQHTYKILLHKELEGQYTVNVPALPGCITYGENIDHAIAMAKEAIELYIEHLREMGKEIPDDNATLEYSFKSYCLSRSAREIIKILQKRICVQTFQRKPSVIL